MKLAESFAIAFRCNTTEFYERILLEPRMCIIPLLPHTHPWLERGLNRNFCLNFYNMKNSFHRTLNQNLRTSQNFLNFRKAEA